MDGTNRTTIATHQLGQPRSIVVDHSPGHGTGRIYWTDAQRRRIESSALDGSNRRIVIGEYIYLLGAGGGGQGLFLLSV